MTIEQMGDARTIPETLKEVGKGEFPMTPVETDRQTKSVVESRLQNLQIGDSQVSPISETEQWGIGKLNKFLGIAREHQVHEELRDQFPVQEGYTLQSEQYLRNSAGTIVKDPETGEARRVDFMVCKDDQVIKSIEVTSESAPKDMQIAKEARIREAGGNYIFDRDSSALLHMPAEVITEVWRRA